MTTHPPVSFRCECDTPERERFIVTSHDGDEAHVEYCNACKELAEADWTGEVAEIRRVGGSPTTPAADVLALRTNVAVDRIARWFDDNGWQGLSESITEYRPGPGDPPSTFLRLLRADLQQAEDVHDDDPDPKLYAQAHKKIDELGKLWSPAKAGKAPANQGLSVKVEIGGRSGRKYRAVLVGARGYEVARLTLDDSAQAAARRALEEWGPLPTHPRSLTAMRRQS